MGVIGGTMLRVGICECNNFYHGKIKDQKISIPSSSKRQISFRLQEFRIPENDDEVLKLNRCHFFLDIHKHKRDSTYYSVTLFHIQLIPNNVSGKLDRIYMGGGIGKTPTSASKFLIRHWRGERLPNSRLILLGIRSILKHMDHEFLQTWLSKMTPGGWRTPS